MIENQRRSPFSLFRHSSPWKCHVTLGLLWDTRRRITDQLLAKADVSRAMHESVQLCQDPQTELALLRESLGVRRTNHVLRVHGHTILHEGQAATNFDEVGQRSLERLFPEFIQDSSAQAAVSADQSGIGDKKCVTLPASTSRSSRRSQPTDSQHDSRRSHSWTPAIATSFSATGLRRP